MTKDMFDFARQRGKQSKIGQLNPMGRFGVAQGMVPRALPCVREFITSCRNCPDDFVFGFG